MTCPTCGSNVRVNDIGDGNPIYAPSPALTREALGKALDRTFPEQRDGKAPHEYADLLLMNLGGTPPPAPTSTREETP